MVKNWKREAFAAVIVVAVASYAVGSTADFRIDAKQSRVQIDVGKAGVFGFAGHAHEVVAPVIEGHVSVDPADWPRSSVSLEFQSAALKVTGTGEPAADVPEVQRVMLSDRVLDVTRYPTVSFRSTRVVVQSATPAGAALRIDGTVTLHGVTRPISVPAQVTVDPSGGLTARGTFTLKQTTFGMDPVTAAGGSIRVKDDVQIQFVLKAYR